MAHGKYEGIKISDKTICYKNAACLQKHTRELQHRVATVKFQRRVQELNPYSPDGLSVISLVGSDQNDCGCSTQAGTNTEALSTKRNYARHVFIGIP